VVLKARGPRGNAGEKGHLSWESTTEKEPGGKGMVRLETRHSHQNTGWEGARPCVANGQGLTIGRQNKLQPQEAKKKGFKKNRVRQEKNWVPGGQFSNVKKDRQINRIS